jgi:hypothetical protein
MSDTSSTEPEAQDSGLSESDAPGQNPTAAHDPADPSSQVDKPSQAEGDEGDA